MTTRKALAELVAAADTEGAVSTLDALNRFDAALAAARAALAQPEPEPVARINPEGHLMSEGKFRMFAPTVDARIANAFRPLFYAAPPPPAPEQPTDDGSTEKTGTVPWPVVEAYSGGADPAGIGGRVWLRMGDGPETVEYVPAQHALSDELQLPDGLTEADLCGGES